MRPLFVRVVIDELDAHLRSLCLAASPLIQPTQYLRQKWVKVEDGYSIADVNDPVHAHHRALVMARPAICALAEYRDFEIAFEREPAFAAVPVRFQPDMGPWEVTESILRCAVVENDQGWRLCGDKAVAILKLYREQLAAEEVVCTCWSRVYRLELAQKNVTISDDISLVALDESEVDNSVGLPELIGMRGPSFPNLHEQAVEIRGTVAMGMQQCKNFFNATHRASEQFRAKFDDVLTALRLVKVGSIELGSISCSTPLFFGGEMMDRRKPRVYGPHLRIDAIDEQELRESYRRVADIRSTDKTLNRAIKSFISSRERPDVYDRIIDLAIAWESLLLTIRKDGETTV